MTTADVILALAKATLLFLAGLAFLRFSRRAAPAVRHLICLCAIGGSLAVLLTLFIAEPAVVIHLPPIAESARAVGTGSKAWSLAEFAAAVWACGCAFVMLRFLIGCAILARVRRSATPFMVDNAVAGVSVLAADVGVPMMTGLFRPVILMPRQAAAWPESRRHAAIRHELAHLKRGDLRTNFASLIACAIYWFHPLVWVLTRQLRAEQEAACDDVVIRGGFDCAEYAEALVETARRADGRLFLSCPMAGRAGVKARVMRVLSSKTDRPAAGVIGRMSKGVLAGLAVTLIAASVVGSERVEHMGPGVALPVLIHSVTPQYSATAMAAKLQGKVRLKAVVGSDGVARDVVVVDGLESQLDRNAVAAARQFRFKPAMDHARPVAVRARIDVNFRLQ